MRPSGPAAVAATLALAVTAAGCGSEAGGATVFVVDQ